MVRISFLESIVAGLGVADHLDRADRSFVPMTALLGERKKRILLTGNTSFVLANFRSGLIKSLISEGHDLRALVPHGGHVQVLRDMGCSIIPLKMDSQGTNPVREVGAFRAVLAAMRDAKPDVVLSFTVKNNLYGGIAARILGIPFIPNVTGLGTSFSDRGLLNKVVVGLYKRGFRNLPIVFFQNQEDGVELRQLGIVRDDQIRLLPGSGVDLNAYRPTELPGRATDPTFLLIARMLWDKGISEFVEAARKVRERFPGARFQMLGPTDLGGRSSIPLSTLEEWVDEGVVTYLGSVPDVRAHLASADCVVLPTFYREGVPRVLLEAAAMARPIITTDTPGCRDTVEDGLTGMLCLPRDPVDLAEKLLRFIEMPPDVRARMGRAGRLRMETLYDERIVVDEYRRAIKDAVIANLRMLR